MSDACPPLLASGSTLAAIAIAHQRFQKRRAPLRRKWIVRPKSGAKFPVRPAEAALARRFDDAFCPSRPRCHVRLMVGAEFSDIEGPLVSCRPRRGFVEVARERLLF